MNREVLKLLKTLKQLNARLYLDTGNLKLDIEKGLLTTALRDDIKRHRDEIISFLSSRGEKIYGDCKCPRKHLLSSIFCPV